MAHISMEFAPKDGTPLLGFWDNGCGWECVVVWWCGRDTYPWEAGFNSYPADKFDCWQSISYPVSDEF